MTHGIRREAHPQIQQRHIVVELGIVRRDLQHRLVADDVLAGHLGGDLRVQPRAIGVVRRRAAGTTGRPSRRAIAGPRTRAPAAARDCAGSTRSCRRCIPSTGACPSAAGSASPRGTRAASGSPSRLMCITRRDVPSGSVRDAADLPGAVVRVRLHRQQLDVHRQHVRIPNHVAALRPAECRCPASRGAESSASVAARGR